MVIRFSMFLALAAVALSAGCLHRADSASASAAGESTESERGSNSQRATGHALFGRVVTADGKPVERVFVAIYGGLATRWRVGETFTDAAGEYRFDPLPGGAMLKNEATGKWDTYLGITLEHAEYSSADGKSWWDVTVPAGQAREQNFTMQPAGAVQGRLTDVDGQPVVNLDLRLCSPNGRSTRFIRYTRTDSDGRFLERGLAPGVYVIEVNAHPYASVGTAKVSSAETTTVALHQPGRD